MKIPDKLLNMSPYEPIKGEYDIRLDANECAYPLPEDMRLKVSEAVKNLAFNRYPDPDSARLRGVAADLFGTFPEMVMAGNGSDELIGLIISSFCPRGGSMLVLEPEFSMYRFYASLCEMSIVRCGKDERGDIGADEIIEAVKRHRPSVVIFSNPCNPTGRGIRRAGVEKIITLCPECLIVVDEAYMDFWTESVLDTAVKSRNVILLRTCSKAFGLAGIRVGFAFSNPFLISLLNRARSPYNVNILSQAAAEAVLREGERLRLQTERIIRDKNDLEREVSALSERFPGVFTVVPTVTNFVILKSPEAPALWEGLGARGISVRFFPPSETLRVTAGTKEQNGAFIRVLTDLLSERVRSGNREKSADKEERA